MMLKTQPVFADPINEIFWSAEDMFGFTRRDAKFARPAALPADSVTLISTEDIYREEVLVIKKGYELEIDELPRLIKHGASPNQFALKGHTPLAEEVVNGHTNPILRMSRSQKPVLVLDADQRSLKKTIDCLFVCGFNLSRIHPVKIAANLDWAMQKYAPQILVIDYEQLQNAPEILHAVRQYGKLEKIILTISSQDAEPAILKWSGGQTVQVLPKPVNRFAMNQLLAD